MSEGNDWYVEQTMSGVKIEIGDCSYTFTCEEEPAAAITHAILLLQDTIINESYNDREADDARYEDARDRYSRVDEKRQELENAIEELVNKEPEWNCAQNKAPFAKVIVKFENGDQLPAKFVGGCFFSPLGIPYCNVKSWRYVDAD